MSSISFKGFKVVSLSLMTEQPDLRDNVSANYKALFSQDSDRDFMVLFTMELTSEDGTIVNIDYAGFFESSIPIDEEFMQSDFPTVNAPAILYPYVRSFVSTLTMNAGLEAIILPTMNFKNIADKKKEETQAQLPLHDTPNPN